MSLNCCNNQLLLLLLLLLGLLLLLPLLKIIIIITTLFGYYNQIYESQELELTTNRLWLAEGALHYFNY